jgi:hypothetical protein
VLSGEIANTSFIIFGFDPTGARNHETFIEYKEEMGASQLDSDDDGHGALGLRVLKRSKNSDHKGVVDYPIYPLITIQDNGNIIQMQYICLLYMALVIHPTLRKNAYGKLRNQIFRQELSFSRCTN